MDRLRNDVQQGVVGTLVPYLTFQYREKHGYINRIRNIKSTRESDERNIQQLCRNCLLTAHSTTRQRRGAKSTPRATENRHRLVESMPSKSTRTRALTGKFHFLPLRASAHGVLVASCHQISHRGSKARKLCRNYFAIFVMMWRLTISSSLVRTVKVAMWNWHTIRTQHLVLALCND